MSADLDQDQLKNTCINLQKSWDDLLKANEAEPASIGGGLYRLAYRGDGYDLLERYGISTPRDGSYPCNEFIANIAMLIVSSKSGSLYGSKQEESFIELQLGEYNKLTNGKIRLAKLGYTTPVDTMKRIIYNYHKEQVVGSKEELQIQILWYYVFANVLVSMFEQIKEEDAIEYITGDYVYKILYVYTLSNITPWHMGISEVHLLDSLCFFFYTLEDLGQISEKKTNSLRAAILSNSEQYNASESIFQKIAKTYTSLLPEHKTIAQNLDGMTDSNKFMIRSFFYINEHQTKVGK